MCKNGGKAPLQASISEKWEEILALSSPLEGFGAKPAVHPLHVPTHNPSQSIPLHQKLCKGGCDVPPHKEQSCKAEGQKLSSTFQL